MASGSGAERRSPVVIAKAKTARSQGRNRGAVNGEARLGFLRRRRVSDITRKKYGAVVSAFQHRTQTSDRTPLEVIDKALDADLVNLYLAGEELYVARYVVCALR